MYIQISCFLSFDLKLSLPPHGELWHPRCDWPSQSSRVRQATLIALLGEARGPIYQTLKCAGLGGNNASSVSHRIKLKWQIMTVGSTPSSYWLSLCQWGLIKFWKACLGPQFETKPTVPQFPLPQVFCGSTSQLRQNSVIGSNGGQDHHNQSSQKRLFLEVI